MIIYNTTYLVSDKVYRSFLKWITTKHIPQQLESGYFKNPRICKVLTDEKQDGTSVSIQLEAENVEAVTTWNEKHGDLFKMEISSLFSEEVLYFCTNMEVIE
ncbi:MAG: DUF4286 family protein [Paludibacteraceae bacterium]|nr:DUF4286 family protein [Paludibacteraceae bacterium]MBN2788113.1 DUF4286 family protein [Paludibacteraceae bacterium]